jgi:tripartite-type tricarboxylate transporter receptor subunit TctC
MSKNCLFDTNGFSIAVVSVCIFFGFFEDPYSHAQDLYPDHEIKLVVPFPAGGAADSVARVIARELTIELGQPVLVDNRPGADGGVAAEHVARAKSDGYTLFMATYGAMSVVPTLHPFVHYNPVNDFTPITLAGYFDLILFVHPQLGVSTVQDFVYYARTHPREILYATGNTGSIVATALLAEREQILLKHIPYKGEVPAMTDFLDGRVHAMIATPSNTAHWVREGKLKALVTLSDKRSLLLPDVPTLREAGLAPMPLSTWGGVFGPAVMPVDRVDLLTKKINAILLRPEIQTELIGQGFSVAVSTSEALGELTGRQLILWQDAIHQAGIPIQ